MHPKTEPPITWSMARAETIRRAIARTERHLHTIDCPRERADEAARLEQLRSLVRYAR